LRRRHDGAIPTGAVPKDLTGTYLRNGPNARFTPIGSYTYWKRLSDQFRLVKVQVYLLKVSRQLEFWQEKKSRQMAWLSPADAALLVDEPQLVAMITKLGDSPRPG